MRKWTITVTEEDNHLHIEHDNNGFTRFERVIIMEDIFHDIFSGNIGSLKRETKSTHTVERENEP